MSRSREFGPTIFQRLEQGSQVREAMFDRATARYAARVNTYVSLQKPNHTLSRLLLAGSAVGIAISFNFIADGLSAEAWGAPTATSTLTPTPTPTPKDAQDLLIEAQERLGRMLSKEEVAALLAAQNERTIKRIEALRNPSPTPNATETREARATAGANEIADRQAAATAAVDPAIARAKERAAKLAKQEQAAELEADNQKTERRIEALRNPSQSPSLAPGGRTSTNEGFPWVPVIIITVGLGAIYAFRTKIPVVNRVGNHIPGPHF